MKNRTKVLGLAVAALLTISSNNLFAQETTEAPVCKTPDFDLGVRGAANMSMLYAGEKELNKNYSFDAGYSVGLTGSYGFTKQLSLVVEVDYSKLNTLRNGVQPLLPNSILQNPNQPLFANYTKKEVFDYIETPVMIRFTYGKKVKLLVNAGPYVGFLTAAKVRTSGASLLYQDAKGQLPDASATVYNFTGYQDVTPVITTVNFGVAGGVGVSYTYEKHTFSVDGRYNVGLTNIRDNSAMYGKNNLQTLAIGLGYSYLLFR